VGRAPQQPERDQGIPALTGWFPRPAAAGDIELLPPSRAWTVAAVLELLADPAAVEWRHKVGVAGPVEGSAKPTTRLLAAGGWVCKLRLDQGYPTAADARAASQSSRERGVGADIWHPDKLWLVMRVDQTWHPATLCRELITLRQLADFPARAAMWTSMLQLTIDVHRLHGLGLDLNPANFATERGGARLYYLDEELYPRLEVRELAGAIVARIPEEPAVDADEWGRWGAELHATLELDGFTWSEIREEIARYPLPDRYESRREALLASVPAAAPRRRRSREGLTCVLADVHANAAALDAVVEDALAQGADRFLFLGDAVGYGPDPGYCIRRLAELPGLCAIRGNHDHAIAHGQLLVGMNRLAREGAEWTRAQLGATELAWLAALPTEHLAPGWIAVHGAPRDPYKFLAYVYELTYDDNLRDLRERQIPLCFYGHTHVQLIHVEEARGTSKLPGPRATVLDPRCHWLVNPGSVGQPRDGDPRAAYALWRPATGELVGRRVAYDVARTVRGLRAAGLSRQLEDRLLAGT